jgi:long-chain acyl-CoA synthetase
MANAAVVPWLHGERDPARIALRGGGVDWTYGRVRARSAALAGALRADSIEPGDRVLLVCPSVPEFAAAYFGVLAAGAVVVAMNPLATAPEISYVLEDSGCASALAWEDCAAQTEIACAEEVPCRRLGPGLEGLPDAVPLVAPESRNADDTAVILYTSGTTGQPKGAELTQANLIAVATIFTESLFELTPQDAVGTALPLSHVFGGSAVMGSALRSGASLSLLAPFEPAAALRMIATDRLTVCAGVPTMLNAIFHEAEGEDVDLSSLRLFASGGASLPEELLTAFEERFGTVVIEGYGLTETCGCATSNRMHRPRKVGTVGTPAPGVSVRLIDSVGEDLLVDEVGEVLIAGPNVMKGYRGLPDATAETIRDGWVHTGDLGSIDADGYLRIVDRIKDLIIRGGYNVYPREVEEVLYRHPDIVEVAVFGVDDERLGEEVAAVAALRAGAPEDVAAIRAWAKERLSSYKVPRLWQFVDTLPKGNTGKILKRAIDRSRFVAQARI